MNSALAQALREIKRLEDLPLMLTPEEVGGVLRLTRRQLYELISAGKLRASNVGHGKRPTYRIKRDDVISFINGDTEQGKAAA